MCWNRLVQVIRKVRTGTCLLLASNLSAKERGTAPHYWHSSRSTPDSIRWVA